MRGGYRELGGQPKRFDDRAHQIRIYERNIKTAMLFLEYLKDSDLSKVNQIVLLFDEEIKKAIRGQTRVPDLQSECYQFAVYRFLDLCSRNAVYTANLEGYLCRLARGYFEDRRQEKRRKREVLPGDFDRFI
jgi:hypothetical protein